jgi:hypothetical protein
MTAGEAARPGRDWNAGTPKGIRTPDLLLEREVSLASRRWGHAKTIA